MPHIKQFLPPSYLSSEPSKSNPLFAGCKRACGWISEFLELNFSRFISFELFFLCKLTSICKLWTKNPQTGYMVERHLWTKNPDEIQNFVFGDVVERHLWTKNPHKFFFKKIKNHLLGISWSVICGQKNHTEFPKY